jgi:16S rRNA processing protein RimM
VESDTVSIGRLGAPKGVRGDLKVHSYSGESAHFRKLEDVELRFDTAAGGASKALRLKIARIEGEGSSLTIAFAGYASPESARVLTGMDIIVPRAFAAPLGPDQWYIDDLVGLALVAVGGTPPKGERLAKVASVLEGGAEPWLESVLPDGRKAIVPFRKEFVGKIDIVGGTIELLVPELLDK